MENKGEVADTFHAMWLAAAELYAEHPVIVSAGDGSCFSYEDSNLLVSATMAWLHDRGHRQGSHILIHADNHPEYLLLIWASLLLGLVVVPVDFSAPVSVLKSIIDEVSPTLVACDEERLPQFDGGGLQLVVFDSPQNREGEELSYSSQIADFIGASVQKLPQLNGNELAAILFTSGSSGKPKGVMLKHGALCRSGVLMAQTYSWNRDDTLLSLGSMHVMSGLRNPAMAALASGTTIVVADAHRRKLAPAVAELCQEYSVSVITSVPAFLHSLIAEQKRWLPVMMESVRQVMVTGAGLDQKSAATVAEMIDASVLNYYGLTETCGLCCYVPLQQPQQGDGMLGVALGADAEVVDENGLVVAGDAVGELRIHSDNLMLGYLSNPELTDMTLRDGWFYTGDLVQRGIDGMLYLRGRRDDRIKSRAGEIIYPDEIARTIQQYDGVLSAVVCTSETAQNSSELMAFVVMNDAIDRESVLRKRLREWLLPQLGAAKMPEQIIFCETLPTGSSGKVDRKKLLQGCLGDR